MYSPLFRDSRFAGHQPPHRRIVSRHFDFLWKENVVLRCVTIYLQFLAAGFKPILIRTIFHTNYESITLRVLDHGRS